MASARRKRCAVAVLAVVALAGCGQLFGGAGETGAEPTLTPAPVPETATAPSAPPATGTAEARQAAVAPNRSRYAGLRPTCERPPGLVIHIQVAALANNDPTTDDGIKTTWRFAAPENKHYTGPYPSFADTIRQYYRPLLLAETIEYGPLERSDGRASRRVTVGHNGTTTSFRWRLGRVSDGPLAGCWMTTSVSGVESVGSATATVGSVTAGPAAQPARTR